MTEPRQQPKQDESREVRGAQAEPERETPAEAPEEPQEPTEAPDEGDTPDEGDESPEVRSDDAVRQTGGAESEQELEKTHKALAAEATRHANRISAIMGEAAQELLPCELCWPPAPGFRFAEMPEEQRSAVLSAIGFQPEPELRQDKHSSVCPDCDGWGKVATGSKVEAHKSETCVTCNAFGWVGPRKTMRTDVPPAGPSVPQSNGPTPTTLTPEEQAAMASLRAKGMTVIEPMRA